MDSTSPGLARVTVGDFVFFLEEHELFVIGKVLESEPCPDSDDILLSVHWWSPYREEVRKKASELDTRDYGKLVFGADYLWEETTDGKRRRVPDVDWEVQSAVIISYDKLVADGKKIPARVLRTLAAAYCSPDKP